VKNDTPKVALVSMPLLSSHMPSFQLALLKPMLEREGIEVETRSLFLDFGAFIGWRLNDALADVYSSLYGEWIWSKAAFGAPPKGSDAAYLKKFGKEIEHIAKKAGVSVKELKAVRSERVFDFLDKAMTQLEWEGFTAVGFSVVFQQLVASLALAKRIKAKHPHIAIMMGGASFEDDIAHEVIAQCDWVDVVHCGDAELTLPDLVRRLHRKLPLKGLPGAMHRDQGKVTYAGRAPNLENLDLTPAPDYDEYFARREATGYDGYEGAAGVMLPIETARGCWYGMKNHCTFCGLNRAGMQFRAKSPPQVLDMLKHLSRRYGTLTFNAIDNILAPEYAQAVFGALASARTDLKLHYEIRPNVSRAQLKSMQQGGLYSVQPGVESFSTHVLTLMKKYTTAVRNLELLKWTTYYGIINIYNLLYGFKGETEADFREQVKLMRKIPHIQPPNSYAIARADRGSPMFEEPDKNGISNLRPSQCYPFIFPKHFDLRRISYFFEDDRVPEAQPWEDEWCETIYRWQERWKKGPRPTLTYFKTVGTLSIHDNRSGTYRALRFDDKAAELYERCADAQRADGLREAYAGDEKWLEATLNEMIERDVMVELDGRYLALALPENKNH
jgi:ribosomal peptide maturation radical SAM protein 1